MFFVIFLSVSAFAQLEVKPESFKECVGFVNTNPDPDYQTDDNYLPFAVIKVRTENISDKQRRELLFEGNGGTFIMLEYKVGEVWVYLTAKYATYLKISHPEFSTYEFTLPYDLQPKKGYEMTLVYKSYVPAEPVKEVFNYLIIKTDQPNAAIYIDDVFVGEKECAKSFIAGEKHSWRVECEFYHSETGEVTISEKEGFNTVIEKKLRPAFGYLNVTSMPESGAIVYIDGKKVGQTPYKSAALLSGDHKVRVIKEMYTPIERTFTVTDGNTVQAVINMVASFVNVSITTDSQSDIYVDNEHKGKGSWNGKLSDGIHVFEAKKASHKTSIKNMQLVLGKDEVIVIPNPEPVYGTLDINSSPMEAAIFIDGKLCGATPKILTNVLIGTHELKLEKEGYKTLTKTITIDEKNKLNLNENLTRVAMTQTTASSQTTVTTTQTNTTASASLNQNNLTFTANGVSFEMVPVKGGAFTMGCNDCLDNQKPAHSETVNDFYIGKFEVTQKLWAAVMGDIPNPGNISGIKKDRGMGDNYPAYPVFWDNAQLFIKKLNEITGENFRMPTEAEWEYAAKGGNRRQGFKYSGCDNIDEVSWYVENSKDKGSKNNPKSQLVGTKNPNELGLYDMSGNVAEWCQELYIDRYDIEPSDNIKYHVLRGGSCFNTEDCNRVTYRHDMSNDNPYNQVDFYMGLRLVIDPSLNLNKNQAKPSSTTSSNDVSDRNYTNAFSVSNGKTVSFSKGNLQYNPQTKQWRFAELQEWQVIDSWTISNGWQGLFGWGTGNNPTKDSEKDMLYNSFRDWGENTISNGGYKKWRTLTAAEWYYVFEQRSTRSGVRYAKATVDGVKGVVLLPDNWDENTYNLINTNKPNVSYWGNSITLTDWTGIFEAKGAVFLPETSQRNREQWGGNYYGGDYWSSTNAEGGIAKIVKFTSKTTKANDDCERHIQCAVRLVCDTK